jgi:uncharacterized protein (UPF0248 family)
MDFNIINISYTNNEVLLACPLKLHLNNSSEKYRIKYDDGTEKYFDRISNDDIKDINNFKLFYGDKLLCAL